MSFPRYSAYKDSGIEWLGEVPAHWTVAPLKRGFDVCLGKMLKPEATSPDDEYLPYLRAANIQWSGVDVTDIKNMWFSPWERQQLALRHGDLLISEGGDVGRSAIWKGEIESCYFQNSVNRVRPIGANSTRFAYYWMSLLKDKGFIDVLCNKSTIAHFTAEKVETVPMAIPPSGEQEAIGLFLDEEASKIDGLISEQEKLIALLKEKRQAVISHAVTKGLAPNVPMKESGIEWLGEVPVHWEVTRLKYATAIIVDCPHETPIYDDEGEYFVVRTADINDGAVDPSGMYRVKEDQYLNRTRRQTLLEKDIVYGREGERWGHAALVPASDKYCLGQRMMQFRASASFNPGFLMWQLNSLNVYRQGEVDTVGATSPHVNVGTIRNFGLTNPPKEEQDAIFSYLDEQSRLIDTLIAEAEKAVALLSEHRSALISAAVTGKIDVRQLAAAEAA